jgi:excisionase family DNA binding protein
MQPGTESGLITVQDAAKFLAVSTSTLYGWVCQRRIPFVKVGRALRSPINAMPKICYPSEGLKFYGAHSNAR